MNCIMSLRKLGVLQQIIVDLLNGFEFIVWASYRDEGIRMTAVETIDVTNESKTLDPLIHAQQIEIRCTDEEYGRVETVKKSSNSDYAYLLSKHSRITCKTETARKRNPNMPRSHEFP